MSISQTGNNVGLRLTIDPIGVAELGYDTSKNTGGELKMISGILMGNWNISKF
jgi:hypothetical protein